MTTLERDALTDFVVSCVLAFTIAFVVMVTL